MKTDWKYAHLCDGAIEFFDAIDEGESTREVIEIKTARFMSSLGNLPCQIFITGDKIEYDYIFEPINDDLDKYTGPFSHTWFKKRPYLRMGWHELKERTLCTVEIYNVLAITETADVLRVRYA